MQQDIGTSDEIPSTETQEESYSHLEVDTRRPEWCFNKVKVIEVVKALQVNHRDDYTKCVKMMRGPLSGIFKIDADDITKYLNTTIEIRGVQLPITGIKKRERWRPITERFGTLVTIFDAFEREFRYISNESFDDYFANMPGVEVVKQTEPQRIKGEDVPNGNRYLVVTHEGEKGAKIDLGTSIEIDGKKNQHMVSMYAEILLSLYEETWSGMSKED